jgi:hypothetical protein
VHRDRRYTRRIPEINCNHVAGGCNLAGCQEQQLLLKKMERIELTPRKVLYDPDKPIEHVFSPRIVSSRLSGV